MDPVNQNSIDTAFPLDALRRSRNKVFRTPSTPSAYSGQSYDNRARISDTAQSLRSRLSGFQTRVNASSFLTGDFSWQVRTADTDSPDAVSPTPSASSRPDTYTLGVSRLASGSTARSRTLDSGDAADIETGTYAFTVSAGGGDYDVELDIENDPLAPLTNDALLKSVRQAIAAQGTGLDADFKAYETLDYQREGTYKTVSYLEIRSGDTGVDASFSITDTSGDLISSLGLDRLRGFAADNRYAVDGQSFSGSSNTVTIGSDGVEGVLTGQTEQGENLSVRVRQGTDALVGELEFLINEYNSLIQWIDANDSVISPVIKTVLFSGLNSTALGDHFVSETGNTTHELSRDSIRLAERQTSGSGVRVADTSALDKKLETIGLGLNKDGTLEMGTGFESAVKSKLRDVYDTLGGETGLFTQVDSAISTIQEGRESQFLRSRSSVLNYSRDTADRNAFYRESGSRLINLFA